MSDFFDEAEAMRAEDDLLADFRRYGATVVSEETIDHVVMLVVVLGAIALWLVLR